MLVRADVPIGMPMEDATGCSFGHSDWIETRYMDGDVMGGSTPRPILVCLIGAPAVGKTTVGRELGNLTGFALFHGHIVADVLTPYFPFGLPSLSWVGNHWRRSFFEEAANAGLDVVTTVAWRFDVPEDMATVDSWLRPYRVRGRAICVELIASVPVRQERNRSESRRQQKNPYWVTDEYIRRTDDSHRYDSGGAFPIDVPHLRIDTTTLPASHVARRIVNEFDLAIGAGA